MNIHFGEQIRSKYMISLFLDKDIFWKRNLIYGYVFVINVNCGNSKTKSVKLQ